jgi:AcrR family transcriptional regulator
MIRFLTICSFPTDTRRGAPVATALTEDLTARARIRQAAFRLFAARGVKGTTLRAIAEEAGTSAALVVHHFGSKEGLVRAVDDAAVATFRAELAEVSTTFAPDQLSAGFGAVFERIIGSDPVMRAYLRRALLQDEPASTALLDEMLEVTREGIAAMDRAGGIRAGSDPQWRPYQALFIALGSMLLEPLLQRDLDGHAFDPDVVRSRSDANLDFFAHGLLND